MVPIGSILAFTGTISSLETHDPGYLVCDGRSIEAKAYPHYARALGVPLEGTITLPDLRGRFLKGAETAEVLETGGTLTHDHPASCGHANYAPHQVTDGDHTGAHSTGSDHVHYVSIGASSHEPPFVTVTWIVRVK